MVILYFCMFILVINCLFKVFRSQSSKSEEVLKEQTLQSGFECGRVRKPIYEATAAFHSMVGFAF